ncbi:tyrosine-protein phosphatase [Paenibacillus sp. 1001270B_150601_E10]|uniref:tyrosine-protein phosphatase n=1 Tax=Paenibacillus sp. 1001270B_150601_E10 TaxID=2787079 RepID=UPI001E2A59BE|nr:CpsB/CapC family capsule biosynthesis tyrosine phosphatase [Paenibacillus sp. 1001270B_150601_E10]
MIDIHTHILPELDDGSASLEMSLSMARMASSQGIRHMIATPHHRNGRYVNDAAHIRDAASRLNAELELREIPLRIHEGQEIRVYKELLDDIVQAQTLAMLNHSRYILLELPSTSVPPNILDLIYELRLLGKVPVLAHPERNAELLEAPDKLVRIIEAGMLCQITSQSLQGTFGKKIKAMAWQLCKQQHVHVIASDCHNDGNRPPDLHLAYQLIESKLGLNYVEYLLSNASRVLHNLEVTGYHTTSSKRLWKLWWRKG